MSIDMIASAARVWGDAAHREAVARGIRAVPTVLRGGRMLSGIAPTEPTRLLQPLVGRAR